MKEFRKTKKGLFICEECNREFKNFKGLQIHIRHSHNKKYRQYFDKWIKEYNDGKCKICNNNTEFLVFSIGYKNCCSKKCTNIYNREKSVGGQIKKHGCEIGFGTSYFMEKTEETVKKKYSVNNISQLVKIKKKKEETCLKNHGVKAGFADKEKREKTSLEKYGVRYYCNKEKYKQTCLERYGVEHALQNNDIRKKQQNTCEKLYGVKNVMHNKEIYNKAQKNGFISKKYKNTDLWYQGSYELDFLEKYYDKYPDIKRGPTIRYLFENREKVYYPDFYIPSLNLVIEIKSSYWYKIHKEIILKKGKAVIFDGFNYILILEKDYSTFPY